MRKINKQWYQDTYQGLTINLLRNKFDDAWTWKIDGIQAGRTFSLKEQARDAAIDFIEENPHIKKFKK